MDLEGKTALVTGGSGDIGGAIARALAQAGADVAISYVGHKQGAAATIDAVRAAGKRAWPSSSTSATLSRSTPPSIRSSAGLGAWTSLSTTPRGTSASRSPISRR